MKTESTFATVSTLGESTGLGLTRVLRRGDSIVVAEALSPTGQTVVVKFAATDEARVEARRQIQRESAALRATPSGVGPALLAVDLDAPRPMMTLERIAGRPLTPGALRAANGATVEATAKSLVEAVAALHEVGITHGAISSRHVLRQPNQQLRLVDFGAASRTPYWTRLPAAFAPDSMPSDTARDLAPETTGATTAPVGPATDVWGIASTLYTWLGEDWNACSLSPTAVARLSEALDPDPRRRPSLEELRDSLESTEAPCRRLRLPAPERYALPEAPAAGTRLAVTGPVGTGKSSTALRWAREREELGHAVAWLEVPSEGAAPLALRRFAEAHVDADLLVVDDAHRLDADSWDWLSTAESNAILGDRVVLFTLDEARLAADHRWHVLRVAWRLVTAQAASADECAEAVARALNRPVESLSPLLRWLDDRANGHPLASRWLLERLEARGSLIADERGQWSLQSRGPADLRASGDLHWLASDRLQGLTRTLEGAAAEALNEALCAAAALPTNFELSALATLLGLRPVEALDTVRPAVDSGVLRVSGETPDLDWGLDFAGEIRVEFAHSLYREALATGAHRETVTRYRIDRVRNADLEAEPPVDDLEAWWELTQVLTQRLARRALSTNEVPFALTALTRAAGLAARAGAWRSVQTRIGAARDLDVAPPDTAVALGIEAAGALGDIEGVEAQWHRACAAGQADPRVATAYVHAARHWTPAKRLWAIAVDAARTNSTLHDKLARAYCPAVTAEFDYVDEWRACLGTSSDPALGALQAVSGQWAGQNEADIRAARLRWARATGSRASIESQFALLWYVDWPELGSATVHRRLQALRARLGPKTTATEPHPSIRTRLDDALALSASLGGLAQADSHLVAPRPAHEPDPVGPSLRGAEALDRGDGHGAWVALGDAPHPWLQSSPGQLDWFWMRVVARGLDQAHAAFENKTDVSALHTALDAFELVAHRPIADWSEHRLRWCHAERHALAGQLDLADKDAEEAVQLATGRGWHRDATWMAEILAQRYRRAHRLRGATAFETFAAQLRRAPTAAAKDSVDSGSTRAAFALLRPLIDATDRTSLLDAIASGWTTLCDGAEPSITRSSPSRAIPAVRVDDPDEGPTWVAAPPVDDPETAAPLIAWAEMAQSIAARHVREKRLLERAESADRRAEGLVEQLDHSAESAATNDADAFLSPAGARILAQRKSLTEQPPERQRVALLHGALGTGKSATARAVHAEGERSAEPLITLTARELSSVGAEELERAWLAAEQSTLLIEEVAALDASAQSWLVRALCEGECRPTSPHLLACTRMPPARLRLPGPLRSDLYHALSAVSIEHPSLSERILDIPGLWRCLTRRAAATLGAPEAAETLIDADPHELAEMARDLCGLAALARVEVLRSLVSVDPDREWRLVAAAANDLVLNDALPTASGPVLTEEQLRALERQNAARALAATEGKIAGPGGAAELLGLRPTTLRSRLAAMGL